MARNSSLLSTARWAYGLKLATRHALISLFLGLTCATVVFFLWYPEPGRQMLGVASIFWLIVAVDVVLGPLLTLLLSDPQKSRRELTLDLSLVALLQLGALAYGMHAAFLGRPVMMVYEVDRFVLVSARDVQIDRFEGALPEYRTLPWSSYGIAGLRQARDSEEMIKSLEEDIAGVSPALRPNWWIPYDAQVKAAALKKAKPLRQLIENRPEQADILRTAAVNTGQPVDTLLYLPLTSHLTSDWIALLNTKGEIVGHGHVDGF